MIRAPKPGRPQSVALNIVQNPLKRSSREQAVLDARSFCELNGIPEQAELYGRAALVARDPDKFEWSKTSPETSALL
ncbi:MAG: hypothetical protein L6R38_003625 [Xanthoria sp. 2 TBL-2021]|nr:MAG: hypothetical protein L6R38_003625 [Xanthoria sp. 2 TBL-2021]